MNAFIEALKEAARLVLMAIVPIVLMGINLQSRSIQIDWFLVEFTGIVTVLRFIDSWLHEIGKEKDNNIMKGGLTRF